MLQQTNIPNFVSVCILVGSYIVCMVIVQARKSGTNVSSISALPWLDFSGLMLPVKQAEATTLSFKNYITKSKQAGFCYSNARMIMNFYNIYSVVHLCCDTRVFFLWARTGRASMTHCWLKVSTGFHQCQLAMPRNKSLIFTVHHLVMFLQSSGPTS